MDTPVIIQVMEDHPSLETYGDDWGSSIFRNGHKPHWFDLNQPVIDVIKVDLIIINLCILFNLLTY